MELSAFSDYSLRTLIYVGLHDDGLATVTELADAYGISRNHIVKVVQRLSQLGYLETHRGRGGGIELARDPAKVIVGKLVRQTESMTLVECFDAERGDCRIAGACELKRALRRARDAFLATLDDYTLADLLRPQRKLRQALGLGS